jgi:hypothetical protein
MLDDAAWFAAHPAREVRFRVAIPILEYEGTHHVV